MTPGQWTEIEALFERARERPRADWPAFLDTECTDAAIRSQVEAMLRHADDDTRPLASVIENAAAAVADAQIGKRLGPYRIVELVGMGGMGAVYLATRDDDEYRQHVAIKILHGTVVTNAAVARMRDERQILAGLDHPGIVRLLDGGRTEEGAPYLVMEHIRGAPIVDHARAKGLSVRDRVVLLHRVCTAVAYAHSRQVLHRDLKPSNILVDESGAPKLLDFGIAKSLDASTDREAVTRTGAAMFTAAYASPEQVLGQDVSPASDVYALGAILYELVADRPPLEPVGNASEVVQLICEAEPPRASTRVPPERRGDVGGDLETIIHKALHKDAAQRYATAEALADDLQRWLGGRPILARPPSVPYRLRKLAGRHRGRLALAGATALVTSIVATVATMSMREAAPADVECQGHHRASLVWSTAREGAVRSAFLATPNPRALDTWRSVDRRLDRFVAEWAAMHREACAATHETGEQSAALLDLRMGCLDRKLGELDAFVALLEHPDPELIERAPRAAQEVSRLGACADATALTAPTPPPDDPQKHGEIAALRERIGRNLALGHAARYAQQLRELDPLVAEVKRVGYPPLIAEALFAQAAALDRAANSKRAAEVMREASYAAERGGDRKLAARSRIELVWIVGHQLGEPQRGLEYAQEAQARLDGLGGDPVLEAQLASNLDTVLTALGQMKDAGEQARRALALRERWLGTDDVQTAIARVNVGVGYYWTGDLEMALLHFRRALATYREQLGEYHPLYAHTLGNIADSERLLGRFADARETARTARRLAVATFGEEHAQVATADHVIALVELSDGRLDAAAAHARVAVEVASRVRGPHHTKVGHYTVTHAAIELGRSNLRDAEELARRGLAIFEKAGDTIGAARARTTLGTTLAAKGKRADALAQLEVALAATQGPPVEDAIALAMAQFALAEVLIADPASAARARELAALASLASDAALRAKIDRWQRAHP